MGRLVDTPPPSPTRSADGKYGNANLCMKRNAKMLSLIEKYYTEKLKHHTEGRNVHLFQV